jgi:hypothetical protein
MLDYFVLSRPVLDYIWFRLCWFLFGCVTSAYVKVCVVRGRGRLPVKPFAGQDSGSSRQKLPVLFSSIVKTLDGGG